MFGSLACFFLYLHPIREAACLKYKTIKNKTDMKKSVVALTKADKMVIRVLVSVVLMSVAVACLYACSKDEPETEPEGITILIDGEPIQEHVTINFSEPSISVSPMTRATLSSVSTRLDVWISDGETTQEVHQSTADVEFGSVSLTLNKTKTYTLYAVGHKGDAAATLVDGVISFPDDKVKDTFWYTTTFSPATTTAINAQMSRIVAMFRIETADAVPTEAKKMRITQAGVYDRWNVTTGATHQLDRISTITISSTASDGTAAFSVYSIVSNTDTLHTVTVEALDASDNVIQAHIFADVPLRNGYKSVYRGAFFTSQSMTLNFTADDWQDFDTINF